MRIVALSIDQAQALTGAIRSGLEDLAEQHERVLNLLIESARTDVHEVLGYPNWPTFAREEFAGALSRLDRSTRSMAVGSLAQLGMSTRTMATILRVGQSTIVRDLAAETGESCGSPDVLGHDGKVYPREPGRRAGSEGARAAGPGPHRSSRRPFLKSYEAALAEAEVVVRRLEELHGDDRFDRSRDHLAGRAAEMSSLGERLRLLGEALSVSERGPRNVLMDRAAS